MQVRASLASVWVRSLILIICFAFLGPSWVWAFRPAVFASPEQVCFSWHGQAFEIPKTFGTPITARADGLRGVVVIQDLHCHGEVQRNIAGMINYLVRSHKLSLVGVEGVAGTLNISALASYPDPVARQTAANFLLDQGQLTGAEYSAVLRPQALCLEGVEDPELYQKSLASLKTFLTSEVQGAMSDLRESLAAVNTEIAPSAMRDRESLLTNLEVWDRLLNVSATPADIACFRGNPDAFSTRRCRDFIRRHAVDAEGQADWDLLDQALAEAGRFYQTADARSRAFASNLEQAMQHGHQDLAVVVVGGYHREVLLSELSSRGFAYLCIQPRYTQADANDAYFSALDGYRTPLDALLAKAPNLILPPSIFPSLNPDRPVTPGLMQQQGSRLWRAYNYIILSLHLSKLSRALSKRLPLPWSGTDLDQVLEMLRQTRLTFTSDNPSLQTRGKHPLCAYADGSFSLALSINNKPFGAVFRPGQNQPLPGAWRSLVLGPRIVDLLPPKPFEAYIAGRSAHKNLLTRWLPEAVLQRTVLITGEALYARLSALGEWVRGIDRLRPKKGILDWAPQHYPVIVAEALLAKAYAIQRWRKAPSLAVPEGDPLTPRQRDFLGQIFAANLAVFLRLCRP